MRSHHEPPCLRPPPHILASGSQAGHPDKNVPCGDFHHVDDGTVVGKETCLGQPINHTSSTGAATPTDWTLGPIQNNNQMLHEWQKSACHFNSRSHGTVGCPARRRQPHLLRKMCERRRLPLAAPRLTLLLRSFAAKDLAADVLRVPQARIGSSPSATTENPTTQKWKWDNGMGNGMPVELKWTNAG